MPEIAPNFDDEKQENITYECRTFEQYLIDYSIPTTLAEIGQTTITGSGTLASPYQINSTQDFVFLANLGVNGKYLELNCDITYNEEVFDENGNPTGGDGVYYMWKRMVYASKMCFEGNFHYLQGFFYEDGESDYMFSIFGDWSVEEIKNVKMKNIFFNLKYRVAGLCSNVNKLKNIVFESGYLYSGNSAGGIAYNLNKTATDCENYANVSTIEYAGSGGICFNKYRGKITNCRNYGTISGISNSGGICSISYEEIIFNCENYGKVIVQHYHGGGIVGRCDAQTTIENCNNYGEIISLANSVSGGMCGMTNYSLTILNCNNYGTSPNQMLGYITITPKETMVITIKGCGAYAKEARGIIGNIHKETTYRPLLVVNIEDCYFKCETERVYDTYIFIRPELNIAEINLKNNVVDIECNNYNFWLINPKQDSFPLTMNVENLIVNAKIKGSILESKKQQLIVAKGTYHLNTKVNIKNAIFNFDENGQRTGVYFGSNFDGYCINWKTGKMTLGRASGKDFFQQKVTEEMLIQKGYKKGVA